MSKTVLPSKFQELKGLDRISEVVHEMKCIFREISKDDFGIDGEIEVVLPKSDGNGFETTGGIIKVQAKSGTSYIKQDSENSFITPVKRNDLEYWRSATFPVLFIVYHPQDDKLYWKDIKSYVQSTPTVFQAPVHITFEKASDIFAPKCYQQICEIAKVTPRRISMKQRERLFSNLLLVKRSPTTITHAPTDYKNYRDLKKEIEGFRPPFCLFEDRLYTFSDLHNDQCSLRKFCDISDIVDMPIEYWATDDLRRKDYVFLLNQLLGIHLRRCGLRYNSNFRRNYFPRQDETGLEFKQDWLNVRTGRAAPARTVAKFFKYGSDSFWRHLAVNLSFKSISQSWYLEIIPKYFFTEDGEVPYDSKKVGPYTTKIKAMERNIHVLNHVLFWADVLSGSKPVIDIKLDFKTAMIIEKKPLSSIANFAIPHDPALYEETVDTGQMDLLDGLFQIPEDNDEH